MAKAKPKPTTEAQNGPWLIIYRAGLGASPIILFGVISYLGNGLLGKIDSLASAITEIKQTAIETKVEILHDTSDLKNEITKINERGTRNRDDIVELKDWVRASNSKIEDVKSDLARIEGRMP